MHYLVTQLGYNYEYYIGHRQQFHSYTKLSDSKGYRIWMSYLSE